MRTVSSDGIGGSKQILAHGFADDGDIGGRAHVVLREERAFGKRPAADIEILRLGAVDVGGPVVISENHLGGSLAARRGGLDRRALAQDGQHVVVDQRLGGAPAHAHAAAVYRARLHKQHVGSHGRDLLLRLLLRALSHADHGDDRAHSDDDAQHGENGAQLVAGQGPHGDTNDG